MCFSVLRAACIGLGAIRAAPLQRALIEYTAGRASIHFELLSAATFALSFRMWQMRQTLAASAKAISGSVLWACTSALFLTPLLARLVGLPPKLALMLSQRSVTTPFALAGARALGASPVLTASVLSIGALYCALLGMKLLGKGSPPSKPGSALARGLAFGCSSYGTGAGTLLQQGETRAAAMSSAALVGMGLVHSLLCSRPRVLWLLHRIAGSPP